MKTISIAGYSITRLNKGQIANWVADSFGLPHPRTSKGGSVDSVFLGRVLDILNATSKPTNAYRRLELALELVGEAYDPHRDTSESRGVKGGSTITRDGFLTLLRGYTAVPRCFIVRVKDWEMAGPPLNELRLHFALANARRLDGAGSGSRVLIVYRNQIVAAAVVRDVRLASGGALRVDFSQINRLDPVLASSSLTMTAWPSSRELTEISAATFDAVVEDRSSSAIRALNRSRSARFTVQNEPLTQGDFDRSPMFALPASLGSAAILPEIREQERHSESDSQQTTPDGSGPTSTRSRSLDTDLNKQTELRAVAIVTEYLRLASWSVFDDAQARGVGYDLAFTRGGDNLLIEVKGIRGTRLAFNMTPLEWARLETEPNFLVIAVTSVLSDDGFKIHVLDKSSFQTAHRFSESYRLEF